MEIIDYFDPKISNQSFHERFEITPIMKKVAIVIVTVFAALLTLPFVMIGGLATYRGLVDYFTPEKHPVNPKMTKEQFEQFNVEYNKWRESNPNLIEDVNFLTNSYEFSQHETSILEAFAKATNDDTAQVKENLMNYYDTEEGEKYLRYILEHTQLTHIPTLKIVREDDRDTRTDLTTLIATDDSGKKNTEDLLKQAEMEIAKRDLTDDDKQKVSLLKKLLFSTTQIEKIEILKQNLKMQPSDSQLNTHLFYLMEAYAMVLVKVYTNYSITLNRVVANPYNGATKNFEDTVKVKSELPQTQMINVYNFSVGSILGSHLLLLGK